MLQIANVQFGSGLQLESLKLRRRILSTPLGLDFTPEQLALEINDINFAAHRDGKLVGCVVLSPLDTADVKLCRMAVDPSHEGQGIGMQIVAFAEAWASTHGFKRAILHARETAVRFYERAGYTASGQSFMEVTIPHREMAKELIAS